ncbi:relaxase/mobilization nuclease domain-containing protein [Rhodoferax sp.]|uniref:relaxase/mobilization nuclease domain-containing protein n=1 Tax=Rhodoferax sp. TaxID=50421 RepID=UPI00374C9525
MISKIIKGTGMQGLVSYAMNGDHRAIIGGNLAGRTPRHLSKEFGQFRKLRPSLSRAVAHLMLSAAPEDPPLDAEAWNLIADIFLKDLGYQSCPHVIFRHNDTGHDHIHIACLRIGPDGKTVPDSNDRFKAERSLARIEEQFGLRRVNLVKKKRQPKTKQEPVPPDVALSTDQSIPTHPKEKGMETNQKPDAPSTEMMPEPLNTGVHLAGHAYALAHGATIMTAWAGDDPNERQRREIKRALRAPGYDAMVKHLLDPDVSNIFHHQRGSVIYLKRPERINDDGDRLTAYEMNHARAAKAMVALACSRGWTSIVFSGPHDFILMAMREAIAQGMPVHPRDPGQRLILEQIIAESAGAMGTVAIPMAFAPPTEPPFPHQPIPEPEPPQPAPEVPAVPPLQLHTDLATKLALRRQQRPVNTGSNDDNQSGPKAPKHP